MKRWPMITAGVLAVAALATVGFVGNARLRVRRIHGNESSIIAFMKQLSSAQAGVQASGEIDGNGDGVGEYGFVGELSGLRPLRHSGARISHPVIRYWTVTYVGNGVYEMSGYYIRIFLPGSDGEPRHEGNPDSPKIPMPTDPVFAEQHWWALAWPASRGSTGNRCFYINELGDILSSNILKAKYSGKETMPPPNAAAPQSPTPAPSWVPAVNDSGASGDRWTVVG